MFLRIFSLALLLAVASFSFALDPPLSCQGPPIPDRTIEPTIEFAGRIDKSLQGHAPTLGYVAGQKELARLWQAWNVGGDAPKVNFEQTIVLVGVNDSNDLILRGRLDAGGNLMIVQHDTAQRKEDRAYRIALVPRAGVRTINGRAIVGE